MPSSIADYFAIVDANGDGKIDQSEFATLVKRLDLHRSDRVVTQVFVSIDENGDGFIDLAEFSRWWAGVDSG